MKRIAVMACVVLGLAVTAGQSFAGWSECCLQRLPAVVQHLRQALQGHHPRRGAPPEVLARLLRRHEELLRRPGSHRLGGLLQEPRLPDQPLLRRRLRPRRLQPRQLRPGRRHPRHDVGRAPRSPQRAAGVSAAVAGRGLCAVLRPRLSGRLRTDARPGRLGQMPARAAPERPRSGSSQRTPRRGRRSPRKGAPASVRFPGRPVPRRGPVVRAAAARKGRRVGFSLHSRCSCAAGRAESPPART